MQSLGCQQLLAALSTVGARGCKLMQGDSRVSWGTAVLSLGAVKAWNGLYEMRLLEIEEMTGVAKFYTASFKGSRIVLAGCLQA